jgi:hypothetical protein
VSGLAGLMRSYAPTVTADELGQALFANALRVGDFVASGRVEVEAAVGSLRAARSPGGGQVQVDAKPVSPARAE